MIDLDPSDAVTAHALSATRMELSPSSADKARLRAALGLPAAALPPAGAAAAEAAAGTLATPAVRLTPLASRWWLGAVGAVLFGAGVATGWLLRPTPLRATAPLGVPAVVSPVATQVVPAARAEATAVAETAAETPPEVARPDHALPRSRRAPAVRAAVPPLDAELALLRRVQRALRNNDPALALALLSELDERFPQTRLAEERLAARSMAECRQEGPRAALRARAFLREHPASVYSERVQNACGLESTAADSTR